MSHAFQALFEDNSAYNEDWAFDSVKELFNNAKGVSFCIEENPLTKKNKLKLTVNDSYVVSIFFERNNRLASELKSISSKECAEVSSIRVLFSPDPENEYDDIAVIIYDFLEEINKVVIYSINQEKVLFDSM